MEATRSYNRTYERYVSAQKPAIEATWSYYRALAFLVSIDAKNPLRQTKIPMAPAHAFPLHVTSRDQEAEKDVATAHAKSNAEFPTFYIYIISWQNYSPDIGVFNHAWIVANVFNTRMQKHFEDRFRCCCKNGSERFRTVPKGSEGFRTVPFRTFVQIMSHPPWVLTCSDYSPPSLSLSFGCIGAICTAHPVQPPIPTSDSLNIDSCSRKPKVDKEGYATRLRDATPAVPNSIHRMVFNPFGSVIEPCCSQSFRGPPGVRGTVLNRSAEQSPGPRALPEPFQNRSEPFWIVPGFMARRNRSEPYV